MHRTPFLTEWALRRPRVVFGLVLASVVVALAMFVRLRVDTDPENMLPADQADRVFHNTAKERFALHDSLVVGIVDPGSEGIYNPEALGRLHALTSAIRELDGVIAKDVMSLATVDDVRPDGPGTVRFSWLMHTAPTTSAESEAVREAVARNPMFVGSLVSEDGQAAAIHVPLVEKNLSHQVAEAVRELVADFDGGQRYFITGLPVAEDTFGVEMFVQMAISAPLAALVIVVMLLLFFRSGGLIASPMLLAMATVIVTMGALIGCGFPVHIMSSMIPIFLMPIAVVDSVHVLSELKDRLAAQPAEAGIGDAIRQVMGELQRPMLFTSLTSAAGFASLALTPIPPVQVFGVFVALGILFAFVLTMTLLPAYVAGLDPVRLTKLLGAGATHAATRPSALAKALRGLGRLAVRRQGWVLLGSLALVGVAVTGISRLRINDNPVRWFSSGHEIRVADRVLNEHFAGTYRTYLVFEAPELDGDWARAIEAEAKALLAAAPASVRQKFGELVQSSDSPGAVARGLLAAQDSQDGAEDAAYEAYGALLDVVEAQERKQRVFDQPDVLRAMDALQGELVAEGLVGKATSLVDVVKTVHRSLYDGDPEQYRVADSARGVAQVLISYRSSHRPDDLAHLVTADARSAALWLQHPSGDNLDVSAVTEHVERYLERHPLPEGVQVRWAGLPYVNVVWQGAMVEGMASALVGSFVIVFLMMVFLFRSPIYGLMAMLPLALTIGVIYGAIGLVGKDYDMPVAVLSALALGLSVDFAIHFLERARQRFRETREAVSTLEYLFEEPARAIGRNLIVIAVGFLPLLFAPLVPYVTVGVLMAAIMLLSGVVTLMLLPALLARLWRFSARRARAGVRTMQAQQEGSQS